MKSSPDARGTFRATSSLTLGDGLVIGTPEGAQYIDGEIKDTDGNIITDQWVIIASQDNIDGISEVKEDSQMVNGKCSNGKWYNLAGQMVNGKLPRGILIQGGRKVLIR